jgi:hypothetical protein
MTEEFKILETIVALDGGVWVSDWLIDTKQAGRDHYCCHSNRNGISPHSIESSNRLFRHHDAKRYLIPCMNHISVYDGSWSHIEVTL